MIDANQLHLPLVEVSSSAHISDQVYKAMKIGGVMIADESPGISLEDLQPYIGDHFNEWQSEQTPTLESQTHSEVLNSDFIIPEFNELSTDFTNQEFILDDSILLTIPAQINHVIFSTDIYADKTSERDLTRFYTYWKNLYAWNEVHEVNEANAKMIDAQGGSWLYIAARANDNKLVEKLLKAGADPNIIVEGNTLLYMAVSNRNKELVSLLLAHHVDPNIAMKNDKSISTPLVRAICDGNTEIAQLLLSNESTNPNIPLNDAQTALHTALLLKNNDLVKILLSYERTDPNAQMNNGRLPLWIAIENGNEEVVGMLLSRKADPDASCGSVPLIWYAAFLNHTDMVKLLLSHNADPNCTMNGTITLLYYAAEKNLIDIVEVLLDSKKTDLNPKIETTIEYLNKLVENKSHQIQSAMKKFINDNGIADSENITITPAEIARILGHDKIEQLIKTAEMKLEASVSQLGTFADKKGQSQINKIATENDLQEKTSNNKKAPPSVLS